MALIIGLYKGQDNMNLHILSRIEGIPSGHGNLLSPSFESLMENPGDRNTKRGLECEC